MLAWMVEDKRIAPHVPVWDKTGRKDGSLTISDFEWSADRNEYTCPEGHPLRSEWRQFKNPRTHITKADTVIYRASQMDCAACSLKERCCPNTPHRKIARSIHEDARAWHVPLPRHRSTCSPGAIERRWRCCSPISNAS